MGFHRHYHAGETYNHTAARENDISDALNIMEGIKLGKLSGSPSGTVRCKCYNASSETLVAGQCVAFSESGSLCGDAIPVENPEDETKPWAVLEQTLKEGGIGSCIVAGCATVEVSGSALDFVVPDTDDPGSFKFSDTGTARVIFTSGGKAVILLGVGTNNTYDGPFAVTYDTESEMICIEPGYVNHNGTFVESEYEELSPQTGTICVYSEISTDEGEWTDPAIVYATPDKYHYPIGYVEVNGDSVTVSCYQVAVAVLIDAAECPLSTEADDQ